MCPRFRDFDIEESVKDKYSLTHLDYIHYTSNNN